MSKQSSAGGFGPRFGLGSSLELACSEAGDGDEEAELWNRVSCADLAVECRKDWQRRGLKRSLDQRLDGKSKKTKHCKYLQCDPDEGDPLP